MLKNKTNALLLVLSVLIIGIAAPFQSHAQTIILNIDGQQNSFANPVTLSLEKGFYSLTRIGIEDGGTFNAWSPWGDTNCTNPEGCEATKPTTFKGWTNRYHVISAEIASATINGDPTTIDDTLPGYFVDDGMVYPTDLDALAKASTSVFFLKASADVEFAISDSTVEDNRGGLSFLLVSESIFSNDFENAAASLKGRK